MRTVAYDAISNQTELTGPRQQDASVGNRLRFGFLNPPGLTDADRDYPKIPTPALNLPFLLLSAFGKGLFYIGKVIPVFELRSRLFAASSTLQRENDKVMKEELGATLFELPVSRPGLPAGKKFQMHCGYVPSIKPEKHKPTVIFTLGSAGNMKAPLPFFQELKKEGYPLVLYQPALLDPYNKHLGKYKSVSNERFQQVLVNDLLALSRALNDGFSGEDIPLPGGLKVPFGQQVLIGHSIGGIVTLAAAADSREPYRAVMAISPPKSYPSLIRHLKENEISGRLVDRLSPERAAGAYQGFFDTTRIPSSDWRLPTAIVTGSRDSLVMRDPEEVFEHLRPQTRQNPFVFVYVKGATHSSVINEAGFDPNPERREPERTTTVKEEQPYYRLCRVLGDLLKHPDRLETIDPETGKYEGIVRFAGAGN